MTSCNESKTCKVLTYDGHRASQRPNVVIFDGVPYIIIECESLYIATGIATDAPVIRGFRVRCEGGRQFKLELTEGVGWQIDPLDGPYIAPE